MELFGGCYLSDNQILKRAERLTERQKEAISLLARPEVSTDPDRMPKLAKRAENLREIAEFTERLAAYLEDLDELQELETGGEMTDELGALYCEYQRIARSLAGRLYRLMLEKGYLGEETEDELDIRILRYLKEMGPEYAWRLGVNLGIAEKEARRRFEVLAKKGLISRVEGTMLKNYHRKRGWTKHMNHTYYRLARKGDHYLRRL